LSGQWSPAEAALLPTQYAGLRDEAVVGIDVTDVAAALADITHPVSRQIAAGVLFRAGRLSPAGMAVATDTASAQGWRKPLLAWLGVHQQRAIAAGDAAAAARSQRRIEAVSSTP
jgi:hypothetical protein